MISDKVLICIPAGNLSLTSFWAPLISWMLKDRDKVEFMTYYGNRVDVNRSRCLEYQKQIKLDMIMFDSDVLPQLPLSQIMNYLNEDMEKYSADVVIAPLFSPIGYIGDPPPFDKDVYEVNVSSLGFTFIPLKTSERLTPVSQYPLVNKIKVPLYFRYTEFTSEDYDFIFRIKAQGMKVLGDKRIKVAHIKYVPFVPPDISQIDVLSKLFELNGINAIINGNIAYVPVGINSYILFDGLQLKNGNNKLFVSRVQLIRGNDDITNLATNVEYSISEIKELIQKYTERE
ncbi:hypothetical protein DFR86_03920 [Acidianus sulfidivorans JP7]|uniref:Uncharacterized protein n=1 Tax=Acidianus sulfidivorans JP7 TaxID=619593 RepID=A0A2U9IL92_9CREN|nr:hypothetical protein [Acidianus sulfidivorans]AWR96787.1 hypothetical protein DFR86_03920 [Acidianus sulfidivorans JP7]